MTMTVCISREVGVCDEPCAEITVQGESLTGLKEGLNSAIIMALRIQNEKTDDYIAETVFEENGEYLDSDGPACCYCDMDAGTVVWRPVNL